MPADFAVKSERCRYIRLTIIALVFNTSRCSAREPILIKQIKEF